MVDVIHKLTTLPGMRERLLGAIGSHSIPNYQHRPETDPSQHNPHNHNIDPAIANSMTMNQHSGGEGSGEGEGSDRRGGKRELSQSKRAAQNRAAQVGRL